MLVSNSGGIFPRKNLKTFEPPLSWLLTRNYPTAKLFFSIRVLLSVLIYQLKVDYERYWFRRFSDFSQIIQKWNSSRIMSSIQFSEKHILNHFNCKNCGKCFQTMNINFNHWTKKPKIDSLMDLNMKFINFESDNFWVFVR